MKKNICGIAVFVFSMILSQSIIAASQDNGEDSWWCPVRIKNISDTLKLDDKQLAQLNDINTKLDTTMKSRREQLKTLRGQINDLVIDDAMDQSKLDGLLNTKTQLISEMIKAETLTLHQVYGVLSKEQRAQYLKIMQEWEENTSSKYKSCPK